MHALLKCSLGLLLLFYFSASSANGGGKTTCASKKDDSFSTYSNKLLHRKKKDAPAVVESEGERRTSHDLTSQNGLALVESERETRFSDIPIKKDAPAVVEIEGERRSRDIMIKTAKEIDNLFVLENPDNRDKIIRQINSGVYKKNQGLSAIDCIALGVTVASLLVKYNAYADYEEIESGWGGFLQGATYVNAIVSGIYAGIGAKRFLTYGKQLCQGKMSKKEAGAYVTMSTLIAGASIADGVRVMNELCEAQLTAGCVFLGIPEIVTVFSHSFEAFQFIFGHQPAKYFVNESAYSEYLATKNLNSQVANEVGSHRQAKDDVSLSTLQSAIANENMTIHKKPENPGAVSGDDAVSVDFDARGCSDVKIYLIKENDSLTCSDCAIATFSAMVAFGSTFFFMSQEQLTALYKLSESNAIDHVCKMLIGTGHFIGNIVVETVVMKELLTSFKNACMGKKYKVKEIGPKRAQKLIAKAEKEQLKMDAVDSVEKKLSDLVSSKKAIFFTAGKGIVMGVASIGTFASIAHYQFTLSARTLDCVRINAGFCMAKKSGFSEVLGSVTSHWEYARNSLGLNVLLPPEPEAVGTLLNATATGTAGNGTQALLAEAAESLECLSVTDPCNDVTFLGYMGVSGWGNIGGIISTAMKPFVVFMEREIIFDFMRRFKTTGANMLSKLRKCSKRGNVSAGVGIVNGAMKHD